jgi:hypothetical protein
MVGHFLPVYLQKKYLWFRFPNRPYFFLPTLLFSSTRLNVRPYFLSVVGGSHTACHNWCLLSQFWTKIPNCPIVGPVEYMPLLPYGKSGTVCWVSKWYRKKGPITIWKFVNIYTLWKFVAIACWPPADLEIWVVDSDWSWLNLMDCDWLDLKYIKWMSFENRNYYNICS